MGGVVFVGWGRGREFVDQDDFDGGGGRVGVGGGEGEGGHVFFHCGGGGEVVGGHGEEVRSSIMRGDDERVRWLDTSVTDEVW